MLSADFYARHRRALAEFDPDGTVLAPLGHRRPEERRLLDAWQSEEHAIRLLSTRYLVPATTVRSGPDEADEAAEAAAESADPSARLTVIRLGMRGLEISIRLRGVEIARADVYDPTSLTAPMVGPTTLELSERISFMWRVLDRRQSPDAAHDVEEAAAELVEIGERLHAESGAGAGGRLKRLRFVSPSALRKNLSDLPAIPPGCCYAGQTALWAMTGGKAGDRTALDIAAGAVDVGDSTADVGRGGMRASTADVTHAVEWMMQEYDFSTHQLELGWQPLTIPPIIRLERDRAASAPDAAPTSTPRFGAVYDCSLTSSHAILGKILSPIALAATMRGSIGLRLLASVMSASEKDIISRSNLLALTELEEPIGIEVSTTYLERISRATPMSRNDCISSIEYLRMLLGYLGRRKEQRARR